MKGLIVVLTIWCVGMLCLSAFHIGQAWELERSWTQYADEWVTAHSGE